jgi:hypothetical protein
MRRRVISLFLTLTVIATNPHLSWLDKGEFFVTLVGAYVCALFIALGMTWARRTRLEGADLFSLAEKVAALFLTAALAITLVRPSVFQVRSCYGACSGSFGGIPASTLVAAGGVMLVVLLVTALLVAVRARSNARLAAVAEERRVARGTRSGLPDYAPRDLTSPKWASSHTDNVPRRRT